MCFDSLESEEIYEDMHTALNVHSPDLAEDIKTELNPPASFSQGSSSSNFKYEEIDPVSYL